MIAEHDYLEKEGDPEEGKREDRKALGKGQIRTKYTDIRKCHNENPFLCILTPKKRFKKYLYRARKTKKN